MEHYSKIKQELNKTPPPSPPLAVAVPPEKPPKPVLLAHSAQIAETTGIIEGPNLGQSYSYETGALLVRPPAVNSVPSDEM